MVHPYHNGRCKEGQAQRILRKAAAERKWAQAPVGMMHLNTPSPTPLSTDRPFSKKSYGPTTEWSVDKPVGKNGTAIFWGQNGGQKKGALLLYWSVKWHFYEN